LQLTEGIEGPLFEFGGDIICLENGGGVGEEHGEGLPDEVVKGPGPYGFLDSGFLMKC
jgi:hypothetical protein